MDGKPRRPFAGQANALQGFQEYTSTDAMPRQTPGDKTVAAVAGLIPVEWFAQIPKQPAILRKRTWRLGRDEAAKPKADVKSPGPSAEQAKAALQNISWDLDPEKLKALVAAHFGATAQTQEGTIPPEAETMSSYTKGEIDAKLDALAARNETALAREVGALRNEMTEGFGNLNTSIARLETTINTSVGIFKFWVPIAVTISIALGTCIGGAVLAAIIKLLVPSH